MTHKRLKYERVQDKQETADSDTSDEEIQDTMDNVTAAITPQTDDPKCPALTFRSVLLGTLWGIFLSCCNILFSFRTNSFIVPSGLAQLLAYPMGVFLARIMPKGMLNPGPFTVKEHVLVYIIAGAAGGVAYGVDNVIGQHAKQFMNDPNVNIWNSLAWVTVTQIIGFCVSGIYRRFLITPASMLWPTVLPNVALFTAMNNVSTAGDQTQMYSMSRLKFFFLVFAATFIWQWIPGFFATVLTSVSFLCFFTKSKTLRFLGSSGAGEGVSLFAASFDWSVVGWYNPISSPWWVTLNWSIGSIFWLWFVIPICYYTNTWKRPPLQSIYAYPNGEPFGVLNYNGIFNASGFPVFVRRPDLSSGTQDDYNSILSQNFRLDQSKYSLHHPFYITETFAISYFSSFLNISALIVHVALWHGKEIWDQAVNVLTYKPMQGQDIHSKLMQAYPQVSEYISVFSLLLFTGAAVIVCETTPFYMPWWATLAAVSIGSLLTLPCGIVQGVTGAVFGLNVISEFLIGLVLPGETVPVLSFKSMCDNSMRQALFLVNDMKLGYYMHVAPWSVVICQLIGTLIGMFFNTVGAFFLLDVVQSPKMFEDPQWKGTDHATYFNQAGILGTIGAARFFGPGSPYNSILYAFLIGLFLPLIPWLLNRIYPMRVWQFVNMPILTYSPTPGYFQSYVIPVLIIGYTTQSYIKNRFRNWFDKYNYVLSIGLSSGMAVSTLVITLLVMWMPNVKPVNFLCPVDSQDYYCFNGDYK